jgi:phosphoglycolate phosphatase
VLFDFEGTLVDFQWRLAEAEARLRAELSTLGFDLAPFDGDNYALLRTRALELAGTADVRQRIERRFGEIYDGYDADALSRWSVREGASGLLARLRSAGLEVGLVTNIGRPTIEAALCRFGLERAFDVVVTRNDVARAKPSGEGILKALALLGVPAGHALFVGDSLSDLAAARAAGVRVAILRGGESAAEDVAEARPDWFLALLSDVGALVDAAAK